MRTRHKPPTTSAEWEPFLAVAVVRADLDHATAHQVGKSGEQDGEGGELDDKGGVRRDDVGLGQLMDGERQAGERS